MKQLVTRIDKELDWHWLPRMSQWTVEQAVEIQQIPAPTFQETDRAAYLEERFKLLNLEEVHRDDTRNVYGLLPGADRSLPGIMISAHTDTVFSAEADLQTRTEEGIIYGPGLGDNSLGVASLLALATILKNQQITPACDLWIVAPSGEEGLGDLCGMKAAFAALKDRIQSVINIEGLALGHIYHAGIAVRRLHITATAGGGHSWLHFGRPSAIHGLIELGARITKINPPQNPRTTYNIGLIEGGQSINTVAPHASMWLDMRSENRETLADLEKDVRDHINNLTSSELDFSIEVVGDRPAGEINRDHPLLQGALTALERIGIKGVLETGSTDGNVPLAAGYPTVTIGITRGGNAHRMDEFIETAPVANGLKQMVMLVLAAAKYHAQ